MMKQNLNSYVIYNLTVTRLLIFVTNVPKSDITIIKSNKPQLLSHDVYGLINEQGRMFTITKVQSPTQD